MPLITYNPENPEQPRYGLLESVPVLPLTDPHYRVELIAQQPPCARIQALSLDFCEPVTGKSEPQRFGEAIEGFPFLGELALVCSGPDVTFDSVRSDALDAFELDWPCFVESSYQSYFSSLSPTVIPGTFDPVCGLAAIAGAIAAAPGAGTGVIYVSVTTAIRLSDAHVLEIVDDHLEDLVGNRVVVSRCGVPDGVIRGETGIPTLWLGDPLVLDENETATMDRNDVPVRIERDGIALSSSCSRFEVSIDLCS